MPIATKLGSFAGRQVANVWEGSKLASSQFGNAYALSYAERAQELRAAREALNLGVPAIAAQAAKARVRTVKA